MSRAYAVFSGAGRPCRSESVILILLYTKSTNLSRDFCVVSDEKIAAIPDQAKTSRQSLSQLYQKHQRVLVRIDDSIGDAIQNMAEIFK